MTRRRPAEPRPTRRTRPSDAPGPLGARASAQLRAFPTTARAVAWTLIRTAPLLALAVLTPACPPPAEPGCPDCPIPTTRPETLAAAACPDWQWVGVTGDGLCPAIPGWQESEIVVVGGPADGEWNLPRRGLDARQTAPRTKPPSIPYSEPTGGRLRRYCRYTDPGGGSIETLQEEGHRLGLDALDRDCMAVIPLQDPQPGAAELARRRELERVFLTRAGRPSPPDGQPTAVPLLGPAAAAEPARLVLIDTVANREAHGEPPWSAPASSPHGVGLANMSRRLTCPGNDQAAAAGDCAAIELAAELALAYVEYDRSSFAGSVRDDVRGGYVGTMSDLAEAIRLAVDRPGPRLRVLNLSVGWNGYLFGGLEDDPADMPVPVRAVLDALELAAGRGAAVVAAAGNRHWGPSADADVGPLLPAGWAVRRSAAGGRLVDAAGGLAFEAFATPAGSRQLPEARFRNLARNLAFADHAQVERHRAAGETAVLTGSSVAAIVASTGAAASWLYLPGRPAGEILDLVHASGDPAGAAADFCLDGTLSAPAESPDAPQGVVPAPSCPSGEPARRVRVCTAAAAACREAGGAGCPSCPAGDVPSPEVDHPALARFAGVPVISLAGRRPLDPPEHELCPPEATRRELAALAETNGLLRGTTAEPPERERFFPGADPDAVDLRCPYWQLPSLGSTPWVDPEPESSPCSTCDFEAASPATIYIDLAPTFLGRLSSPVLRVGADAYALDWDPNQDPRAIVEGIDYEDGETVILSFALDNGLSATSALLRVR